MGAEWVAGVGKQALKAAQLHVRRVFVRAEVKVRERAVARGPGARGVGGGGGGEGVREGGMVGG